jgi:transglutaminase-like putative cysteine protease
VEFEGEPPAQRLRYWRGPVLWDFDGRTWTAGPVGLTRFEPPRGGEATFRYEVLIEPHNRNWLFALETAASLPARTYFTADGQLLAYDFVRERRRYRMTSVAGAGRAPEEQPFGLRRAVRLPAGFNPRATALAAQWRRESASDADIVARAVGFFIDQRFLYTLDPALLGRDSVDDFLFGTREGFCEHFASAFVFLVRAAGVPARVVTGYLGGEVNSVDGIFTVRQSDAHAWAEVHLGGRGWVRVDPTSASNPGRLEAGLARAMAEGVTLPFMWRPELEWLRGLRSRWEAITHRWNVWVLGYNSERQRDLMRFVGMRDADWRALTAALFTLLGTITALLLLWSLRRLQRPDPVQKAWQAFCRKLAARGVTRAPQEGPRDYSERAARALPRARGPIRRIGELYIALRYGAQASAQGIVELRRRVQELRLT